MLWTKKDLKNIQDWLWQSNFTLGHPFWVTLKDEDSLGAVPNGIKIRSRGQKERTWVTVFFRENSPNASFLLAAPLTPPDCSDLLDLILRSKGVSWKQESPVTEFSLSIYLKGFICRGAWAFHFALEFLDETSFSYCLRFLDGYCQHPQVVFKLCLSSFAILVLSSVFLCESLLFAPAHAAMPSKHLGDPRPII